jgi:hypothetical protein
MPPPLFTRSRSRGERLWTNARVAVPAVLTFVPLMLLATFIHLNRFHLGARSASARVAGWGSLSPHVAVVAVVPVRLIAQWRVRGPDEERGELLPPWLRAHLPCPTEFPTRSHEWRPVSGGPDRGGH